MIYFRTLCLGCIGLALALLVQSASGQEPPNSSPRERIPGASPSAGLDTARVNIHGPFVLSGAALAKMREKDNPPRVKFIDEEHKTVGNISEPVVRPSRPATLGINEVNNPPTGSSPPGPPPHGAGTSSPGR